MENIYSQSDLLRVNKAILNATEELAKWLRSHTRNHFSLLPKIYFDYLAKKIEPVNQYA